MEKTIKYWITLSVVLACAIFLSFKQFKKENWNRCISSDGKGYYAYLPAFFIYHDLQFQFVSQYETKYYHPENNVNFTNKVNGKVVNKYWMGTAVLISPFFLMAHVFATLLHLPNDGYSFVYQMMVAVAACFYLLIGLHFIRRLLLLYHCNEIEIFLALFALVFATNLFYYTVAEPSMSHVYSMAAISAFAYFSKAYFELLNIKYLKLAILLFGIILLIRPSNAIVVLAIPFFAASFTHFKWALGKIKFVEILPVLTLILFLLSMQFIYYNQSTGLYFIYSYGNENFNFLKPHLFDFLFSYRRGLFLYAPILLISLLGLIQISKISIFKALSLLIFLFVVVYFLSSWWMWYYGGGFGMRPVIDFFVFFALPLTFLIQYIIQFKWLKRLCLIVYAALIFVTQIQTYQKVNFILPWDGINKEIYWKLFLKTNKSYIGKYQGITNA